MLSHLKKKSEKKMQKSKAYYQKNIKLIICRDSETLDALFMKNSLRWRLKKLYFTKYGHTVNYDSTYVQT